MPSKATTVTADRAYSYYKDQLANVKNYCEGKSLAFSSGATSDQILVTRLDLYRYRAELQKITSVPGIAQYASDQEGEPTYDVITEHNLRISSIDAVIASIESTFPADGNGFLLSHKFNGSGYEARTFSSANLATLKSLLDAVVAGIE